MAYEIQVDPNSEFVKVLKKAREVSTNLSVPFNSIAKSWFRANRSIFSLQGPGKYMDLGGFNRNAPAWPGSSVTRGTYSKFKKLKKHGFVYPLMKADGRLEASLTQPSNQDSINLIVNNTALYLGTRVPYAQYHQSPGVRRKIPYRPIVFVGVEQVAPTEHRNEYTRWVNIIKDYIVQKLQQSGVGHGGV